jgi:Thaumarchaeal output domain 1
VELNFPKREGYPVSPSTSSTQTIALGYRLGACSNKEQPPTRDDGLLDKISVLCIPSGFEHENIPGARQVRARGEMPDVVVLTAANAAGLIAHYLPPSAAAIVPVIDASGEDHCESAWRCGIADLRIKAANSFSLSEALSILKPTIDRVRALAEPVLTATDPRITLLARLAVRGRDMEPKRDPSFRETVTYSDTAAVPDALTFAEELAGLGFLERKFFDKLVTCPRCDSARLCVRERCTACHSADLVEEAVIHHLRCSAQAPEHDFRQGASLICPKCRLHLEHFSVDYDRPGSVMLCRNCGYISTDAAVGFTCLDCEKEGDMDETGTRIAWRYRITEAGIGHVKSGVLLPKGLGHPALDRLATFISREKAAQRPFCVLVCRLANPQGLNQRLWEQSRALFGTLFREMFTPQTETIDIIVGATPLFLALLQGDHKSEVERALPNIRVELERHLSGRPRVDYAIFGPDEMTRILGGQRLEGATS